MSDMLESLEDLAATARRPERGDAFLGLRPVPANRGQLRETMSLQPDKMYATLSVLGQVVQTVPRDTLRANRRTRYRRLAFPNLGTILRNAAGGLAHAQAMGVKLAGAPAPEVLLGLVQRQTHYEAISGRARRGRASLLDLRLVLGGLQRFAMRKVMEPISAMLEDPAVKPEVKAALKDAFAGPLLYKERLLSDADDQRGSTAEEKARREAELRRAEQMVQMQDVIHARRAGRTVDPVALAEAAAFYTEEQQRAQEEVAATDKGAAKAGRKVKR